MPKRIFCCGAKLEFILTPGEEFQEYVPETALCNACGSYYEKKQKNDFAYKTVLSIDRDGNELYKFQCTKCSSIIQIKQVKHKGIKEDIPYCPKCEK
ncbi:MAG: hypothetical protein PHW96_04490 [Candidatus Nanoarchaeia archaeon]|nr:hypothetical protein [Candidatus Nanoarchaeia archaeon]